MKIETYKCPNCNALINPPSDKSDFFCMYCGGKLHLDDEIKRVEIIHTHIMRDETKIEELRIREKEASAPKTTLVQNVVYNEAKKGPGLVIWVVFILSVIIFIILAKYVVQKNVESVSVIVGGPIIISFLIPPIYYKSIPWPFKLLLWLLALVAFFVIGVAVAPD